VEFEELNLQTQNIVRERRRECFQVVTEGECTYSKTGLLCRISDGGDRKASLARAGECH